MKETYCGRAVNEEEWLITSKEVNCTAIFWEGCSLLFHNRLASLYHLPFYTCIEGVYNLSSSLGHLWPGTVSCERRAENFLGFAHLGCIVILLGRMLS
jgi:hypothetical protein